MKIDLSKHPRLQLVINYANKTNCLNFSPQSEELQLPDQANHIQYRSGFYSEDITGFWNPGSFFDYVKGNIEGYKDGLEFGKIKALEFLSLSLPWSGWVWTLDSFDSQKHDIVMDRIRKEKNKKKKDEIYSQYDKLVSEVKDEEVLAELKRFYVQIRPNMFVSRSDPSVIVYDQRRKPYSLQHGWSKDQVGDILTEWLEAVAGIKVPYKFIDNARW